MKKKKRTSKRTNLRTKALIRKRKLAFHKRAKKQAKQMIAMGIKPRNHHKKTQLSVPNLCPFKKDLLEKALKNRKQLKLELELKKKLKKDRVKNIKQVIQNRRKLMDKGLIVPKSLKKTSWANTDTKNELKLPRSKWEHKHFYYKELNQVIAASDIVIEVLDARDPLGCRSKEVESKILRGKSNILNSNKRLILLLNKIDLIPSSVLASWMKILRREYPVIAFKASTQKQKRKLHSNLKYNRITSDKLRNNSVTNRCIGSSVLIELLKKYSLSLNVLTPITVGFIGYPNTGKSSIINSLARTQCVGTSFTAGFTKTLCSIKLDKYIKLIDSPGVIFNNNNNERINSTRLVLRNALKLQDIDPIETVAHILSVANHKSLSSIYGLSSIYFQNVSSFLSCLSFKLNHLKAGGIPDMYRSAQLMVNDWNHGKIPFYVKPPSIIETNTNIKFISKFQKEFNIDDLLKNNNNDAIKSVEKQEKLSNINYLSLNEEQFIINNNNNNNNDNDNLNDDVDDDNDENMKNMDNNVNLIDDDIMKTHAFMTA